MTLTRRPKAKGFTLSELLIALAILGLIATFTIPKVLNSVGERGNITAAKEAISVISSAYDGLRADGNGSVGANTTGVAILNRLNFVTIDTSATLGAVTNGTVCHADTPCYVLHSGSIIQTTAADNFVSATADTGTVGFNIYPDGGRNGANSPAAIRVMLGHDGRIMTDGLMPGYTEAGGFTAVALPDWFSWS